jgi:DUF4097 and DUF4098 domain-containing protein YvlB
MQSILLCTLLALIAFPLAAVADRIERQVPVTAGGTFDVDLKTGGTLTIRGADDGMAEVTVERDESDVAHTEVVIEPTSGGLRLATRYLGNRHTTHASDLRIEVRLPQRFNVHLRSAGGAIHLEGLEGEFKGVSQGGKLELTELRGSADLVTMGGDIDVSRSHLSGKVSTNGGKVVVDRVGGGLQAQSLGGQVTRHDGGSAGSAAAGGGSGSGDPVVMSSMGGRLEVEAAPNGADLKTMGGKVHVRQADKFVKAVTMGGDIVIDRVDGRVDATTMAGDVTVTVTGDGAVAGSHAVRLSSNTGELRLTVPADLPVDIDVELYRTRDSRRDYHVHSDFPLKIEESADWDTSQGSPRKLIHATGRQGAATQRIELRTINGDVYITRAR